MPKKGVSKGGAENVSYMGGAAEHEDSCSETSWWLRPASQNQESRASRTEAEEPLRSDLRTAERRRPQSPVGCDLCLPRKSLALKTDQVLTLSPETSPLVLHQLGCVFLRSLLVSLPALHLLAKTPGSLLLCSIGNMSAALLLILLSIEPKVLEELDRLVAERAESSTPQSSIPQFRVWTCPLCQRLQSGASD